MKTKTKELNTARIIIMVTPSLKNLLESHADCLGKGHRGRRSLAHLIKKACVETLVNVCKVPRDYAESLL